MSAACVEGVAAVKEVASKNAAMHRGIMSARIGFLRQNVKRLAVAPWMTASTTYYQSAIPI